MSSKNSTVQPYVRPNIKDPLKDPLIAMSKARRAEELANDNNARQMSAVSGGMLHRTHDLKALHKEMREIQDSIDEYEAQMELMNKRKATILKTRAEHQNWIDTFNSLIGTPG
jgi:chromosome segregation ATPase|mmetsp:Transcript_31983/g.72168  ORF Transcript_31983/g.72168 Transcript_31983/m.72168 type:complete len:113 (-) Transcript_31983:797-1135(-)